MALVESSDAKNPSYLEISRGSFLSSRNLGLEFCFVWEVGWVVWESQ